MQLVEALQAHRAAQQEERIAADPLGHDHDLLFSQADGRPIAATLLLSEGVHPRVVMAVLGHAQMRTTTDTYSHDGDSSPKKSAPSGGAPASLRPRVVRREA